MDDRTLVRGILEKDPAAERFFWETYHPKLRRLSTFILGFKDPDVEDAVQETLMAAYADLAGFNFESNLYSWLYRICVHRCNERIRKRWRQVVSLTGELDTYTRRVSADRAGEKEEEGERQAFLEILTKELKALGAKCRELLKMRDERGLSYVQMAGKLKVPMGTVMSRLARCKEALKERVMKAARLKGLKDG